jgi:GT2 family glycosyltransferase
VPRDEPAFSVIVLSWNGREYLEECLSSLSQQDLPDDEYEVVVADNGSTDGSADFVERHFPAARVVRFDKNYGYAEGNNRALRHARGRYVVFLNQDTVVHAGLLRGLRTALEQPKVGACHANVIQPWYPEYQAGMRARAGVESVYTIELSPFGHGRYRKLSPSEERQSLFLHGVCIAMERSIAEGLEYVFDADMFAYAEDLDLGLRLRHLGYRTVVAPQAVVYHKHTLDGDPTPKTFAKAVRIIRNRYLTFFKCMGLVEFMLALPLITLGGPLNAMEFGLGRTRRIAYFLALVPATAAALAAAMVAMPRYAGKRRRVLGASRSGRFRLLREMLRQPGPAAGAQESQATSEV